MDVKTVLLVLAISASGLACAGTMEREQGAAGMAPADSAVTGFQEVDKDNSGYVERGEAVENGLLSQQFNESDANNDGRLTTQEFEAAVKEVPGQETLYY